MDIRLVSVMFGWIIHIRLVYVGLGYVIDTKIGQLTLG